MNLVVILQDAADFDVRKREDLLVGLQVAALRNQKVFCLDGQRKDRAVGMDRTALDVGDLPVALQVRKLDRRQLLALFGEYFDSLVKTLVMKRIVFELLNVEVHRRRSRRLGIGGHFQLVRIPWLKFRPSNDRRQSGEEQNCAAQENRFSHHGWPWFLSATILPRNDSGGRENSGNPNRPQRGGTSLAVQNPF